jgi:hypothetical protein
VKDRGVCGERENNGEMWDGERMQTMLQRLEEIRRCGRGSGSEVKSIHVCTDTDTDSDDLQRHFCALASRAAGVSLFNVLCCLNA